MAIRTNRTPQARAPALRLVLPPEMECDQPVPPVLHPGKVRPKRRLPPEVLSDAEVCALMGTCGRHAPTGMRNRALIALLYRTGLRINEALSLYPKDLELTDGSVRVLHGKGGRSRTVGLDPGAAAIIERWLDARSRLGLGGRNPVFCTLRGHAMSDAYIRVMLKRLAARAGIDKRVHAHGLRHTHAAQLRAEGVDIAIISANSATPASPPPPAISTTSRQERSSKRCATATGRERRLAAHVLFRTFRRPYQGAHEIAGDDRPVDKQS